MNRVDPGRLDKASRRLGEATLDPGLWTDVMDDISAAVGATGAVLFQSDVRTADVPRTAGAAEMVSNYFRNGWQARDLRAARAVPRMLSGELVITDQDLVTPDEMRDTAYYNEMLLPYGFRWFAGIGFWAASDMWALCLQRSGSEGPFEDADKSALSALSARLTEAATLSTAVGRQVIAGMLDALELVRTPALMIDRLGGVIATNRAAEGLFDDDVRVFGRRVVLRDAAASAAWERLTERLRLTGDAALRTPVSLVARRRGRSPVLIRALSVPDGAGSPFLGARAIVTLAEAAPAAVAEPALLAQMFGLTAAEARLGSLVATGIALPEAANRLGISHETARNQLKSVFAKTDTHRQAELAALLSRLPDMRGSASPHQG